VLATVDELESRLRAAGHDVYDFGLGNPTGASPPAVEPIEEAQTPGNQHAVAGVLKHARRSRLVRAQVRQSFDPDSGRLGREGRPGAPAAGDRRPGDCVLARPLIRFIVSASASRATGAGADRAGTRRVRRIEARSRAPRAARA
jgi:hypothetical protein